jgi:hypothetical protein
LSMTLTGRARIRRRAIVGFEKDVFRISHSPTPPARRSDQDALPFTGSCFSLPGPMTHGNSGLRSNSCRVGLFRLNLDHRRAGPHRCWKMSPRPRATRCCLLSRQD